VRRNTEGTRGGNQILKSSRGSTSQQSAGLLNPKRKTPPDPLTPPRGSSRLISVARSFAAKILDFELHNQATADLAGKWRQQIDAQERKVIEWFAPAKQAAFKSHAIICRQENDALAPYREARRLLNAKLAAWKDDLPRRSGVEGEQSSNLKLPADRSQTSDLAVTSEPGLRVEGISFRENWRAEVVDKLAFVAAISGRPELIHLVDPNLSALGHLARAQKDLLNIPGVRVWREQIVATSRRS
jgi:hypothetical protein